MLNTKTISLTEYYKETDLFLNEQGHIDRWRIREQRRKGKKYFPPNPTDAIMAAAERFGILYFPQPHVNGCVPAAVSMITGIPYKEVVTALGGKSIYLCGTSWGIAVNFLQSNGWTCEQAEYKDLWTIVPKFPSLLNTQASARSHATVLLPNGTVLDPVIGVPMVRDFYCNLNALYLCDKVS